MSRRPDSCHLHESGRLLPPISGMFWRFFILCFCVISFSQKLILSGYCYKDEQKKSKRTQLEIDFVANKGSRRYYIQSALTVADEEKRTQEVNSLNRVGDSFKKIVVVKDNIIPWHDENGILYVGIEKFLLNETAMEL